MLTEQLVGLEGWRVEAVDHDGRKRRFIVGRTAEECPRHLEWDVRKRAAPKRAMTSYRSVTKLRQEYA